MSEDPKISDPSYRDSDIKIGILIVALCGITVIIILAFIGMNALFKSQEKSYLDNQVLLSERLIDRQLPSDNILQVNEKKDYKTYYKEKMEYLNSSEILNEDQGIARISISDAKDYVVTRGLMALGSETLEPEKMVEQIEVIEETKPLEEAAEEPVVEESPAPAEAQTPETGGDHQGGHGN